MCMGRPEYGERIDSEAVEQLAAWILDGLASNDDVWAAASIHDHITDSVEYDCSVTVRSNRGPAEIYDQGGDSVDIAILICSLFRAAGLSCQFIVLEGDDSDHPMSAVSFPRSPRAVTGTLTSYYAAKGERKNRIYTWFQGQHFVADYSSRYVGDADPVTEYTDERGCYGSNTLSTSDFA